MSDLRPYWVPEGVFIVPAIGRLVEVVEEDFYEFLCGVLVISTITVENVIEVSFRTDRKKLS